MITPKDLPRVRPGKVLRLAKGEWSTGMRRGEVAMSIRVVEIKTHAAPPNASGVWVVGHGIECAWPSAVEHDPCVHLYVYLDALAREVSAK